MLHYVMLYYGYRDEDDGVIVAKEVVQEVSVRYVRQLKSRCDMRRRVILYYSM